MNSYVFDTTVDESVLGRQVQDVALAHYYYQKNCGKRLVGIVLIPDQAYEGKWTIKFMEDSKKGSKV